MIIEQGQLGEHIYFIINGVVKVYSDVENKKYVKKLDLKDIILQETILVSQLYKKIRLDLQMLKLSMLFIQNGCYFINGSCFKC